MNHLRAILATRLIQLAAWIAPRDALYDDILQALAWICHRELSRARFRRTIP